MSSRRKPPALFDPAREQAWQALNIGPSWIMRGAGEPVRPVSDEADAESTPAVQTESIAAQADAVALDSPPQPEPATERPDQPVTQPEQSDATVPVAPAPGMSVDQMDWATLQATVTDCQRCGLCQGRQNTVFGVGDENPRWVIVGEAPGAQEDRTGQPFVGEAGQLLDAMLAAAGASRGKGIYILNVLKCRPPNNRDPSAEEVASCRPFLMRQLELLQPELILTMGRFAAQTVLSSTQGIGQLRSKVHQTQVADRSIPVVAAYHPAYLLRQPDQKPRAWADLCLARSVCEPGEPVS